MKFDYISDFHVEHHPLYMEKAEYSDGDPYIYPWNKEKKSDILILGGDCSNSVKNTIMVITEAKHYYDTVIFIDGNHEHWCGRDDRSKYNIENNIQAFRKFAKNNSNVHFLDSENSVIIDDTMFIGACGWYDFAQIKDFTFHKQIASWKKSHPDFAESAFGKNTMPWKLAKLHATNLASMVDQAQDDDSIRNIVISTHTVPHPSGVVQDETHPFFMSNGAFINTKMKMVWEADVNHKIKTWTFGHTHFTYDFNDNGIRFVCNPRGYGSERWASSQRHILQLDTDTSKSAFEEI